MGEGTARGERVAVGRAGVERTGEELQRDGQVELWGPHWKPPRSSRRWEGQVASDYFRPLCCLDQVHCGPHVSERVKCGTRGLYLGGTLGHGYQERPRDGNI